MRVCILTQPRTSSTNLLFLLGELSGYSVFNEPFHKIFGVPEYWVKEFTEDDNIILKEMPFYHNPVGVSGYQEFFEWSEQKFDKTFYLIRRNTLLQSESFTFHMALSSLDPKTKLLGVSNNSNINPQKISWHSQKWYDMSIVHPAKIEIEKKLMEQRNEILINHSIKTGNPIFYYEDLIENSGDNHTLRSLLDFLSLTYNHDVISKFYGPHRKYRIEIKNNKTLI